MSNYPPGVSGREYQISGPDTETEQDIPCPNGHSPSMVYTYGLERWGFCFEVSCHYGLENPDKDSFDLTPDYEDNVE